MNILLLILTPLLLCLIGLVGLALLVALLIWLLRGSPAFVPRRYPPSEYYIQDELILTGPSASIDAAIARANTAFLGLRFTLLRRLEFRSLEPGVLNCPGLPHTDQPGQDLVIDLYRFSGPFSSIQRALRQIQNALGPEAGQVARDPNWLTGQPHEVEGSPHEVEGSPHEVEGSGLKPQQITAADNFWKQWALENIGFFRGERDGDGVRVGVFDASPFKNLPMDSDTAHNLLLATESFSVTVRHPQKLTNLPAGGKTYGDLSNHGYFASGLIKALAPNCDLHLIQVLDDDNRGDLFRLLAAIFEFLMQNLAQPPQFGTVLNCSLGIRLAPAEARFGLPNELLALKYLMIAAHCLNVTVVSAAGNESGNRTMPQPANWPAALPMVIAVAANTHDLRRSCFSNQGQIAAPGGDGRPVLRTDSDGCQPRNTGCSGPDCPSSVIGPVLNPPYSDESNTAHAFWSGTSFSAPLVTGLAARLIQIGQGAFSPSEVAALIACGATRTNDPTLGAGVINLQRSLNLCGQLFLDSGQSQKATPSAAQAE